MRFVYILIVLFMGPFSAAISAEKTVAKWVPDPQIVGSGRLTFWGFEIYDATLYAPQGQWSPTNAFALKLSYLRPFSGDAIAQRSVSEIKRLGAPSPVQIAQWQTEMMTIFPDVRAGDVLIGVNIPNTGARFYNENQFLGEITDPEFAKWFFGIWLSPDTRVSDLRRDLLKQ